MSAVIPKPKPGSNAGSSWAFSPEALKSLGAAAGVEGVEALARLLDSDHTTLWRTFTGRSRPLGETVVQWAEALGCDVKDFYVKVQP